MIIELTLPRANGAPSTVTFDACDAWPAAVYVFAPAGPGDGLQGNDPFPGDPDRPHLCRVPVPAHAAYLLGLAGYRQVIQEPDQ